MDAEDLEPKQKKPQLRDLDPMSIEELQDYIAELKTEIARVEDNIAVKQKHREGVEGIFKK